jgi:hypothetical protein
MKSPNCPHCKGSLNTTSVDWTTNPDVRTGIIVCAQCQKPVYFSRREIWGNVLGQFSVIGVERFFPTTVAENETNRVQFKSEQSKLKRVVAVAVTACALVIFGLLYAFVEWIT